MSDYVEQNALKISSHFSPSSYVCDYAIYSIDNAICPLYICDYVLYIQCTPWWNELAEVYRNEYILSAKACAAICTTSVVLQAAYTN